MKLNIIDTRLTGTVLLWAVLASSCFTGIESTPKITADDVRRQNITVTPEEHYLDSVSSYPLSSWQPGKQFYVTDSKISLLLSGPDRVPAPDAGSVLTYVSSAPAVTISGEEARDITFRCADGKEAVYRLEMQKLRGDSATEIPFTIDLDLIRNVRGKMLGQEYYTVSTAWYDTANLQPRNGRRFIKARVTDVQPGNSNYPVRLTLVDTETAQPDTFCLFMSVGKRLSANRRFETLLSLTDPKKRYPDIPSDHWPLICNGRIAIGMTREECRLALGNPVNVERRAGYESLGERWTYENGRYLIFTDGRLSNYR